MSTHTLHTASHSSILMYNTMHPCVHFNIISTWKTELLTFSVSICVHLQINNMDGSSVGNF